MMRLVMQQRRGRDAIGRGAATRRAITLLAVPQPLPLPPLLVLACHLTQKGGMFPFDALLPNLQILSKLLMKISKLKYVRRIWGTVAL
jgi:hypothetical protein